MKKILFNNNKNVISKTLKISRIKQNLSQSQLAAKMQTMGVNIDQQMISKIENNTRFVTDYELACFCTILNVKPEEMLEDFYNSTKQSDCISKKSGIFCRPFLLLQRDSAIIVNQDNIALFCAAWQFCLLNCEKGFFLIGANRKFSFKIFYFKAFHNASLPNNLYLPLFHHL